MRRLRILEAAAREAEEAADWYERECPGLGARFSAALDDALDRIEREAVPLLPLPGKAGQRGARRFILKRFPFDVIVCEQRGDLVVIAFSHHARRPGYWRERLMPPA